MDTRGTWQRFGACDACGPEGACTHAPTGLEQSLDEMEFTRSACSAAQSGDAERLQRMIVRNPGCVHHDGGGGGSGYTPLHYAARAGHAECVALLLREGSSVHARTAGGATALHRAAYAGQARVCALLLRAGARPAARDSDGETPHAKAAAQGRDDVLAVLAAHAAEAGVPSAPGADACVECTWK